MEDKSVTFGDILNECHAKDIEDAIKNGLLPASEYFLSQIEHSESLCIQSRSSLTAQAFLKQVEMATLMGLWLFLQQTKQLETLKQTIRQHSSDFLRSFYESLLFLLQNDTLNMKFDYPIKALILFIDECNDVETIYANARKTPEKKLLAANEEVLQFLATLDPTAATASRRLLWKRTSARQLFRFTDQESKEELWQPSNKKAEQMLTKELYSRLHQHTDVFLLEQLQCLQNVVRQKCLGTVTLCYDSRCVTNPQNTIKRIFRGSSTISADSLVLPPREIIPIPCNLASTSEASLIFGRVFVILCTEVSKTTQLPSACLPDTHVIYLIDGKENSSKQSPVATSRIIRVYSAGLTDEILHTLVHLPVCASMSSEACDIVKTNCAQMNSGVDRHLFDKVWHQLRQAVLKTIEIHTTATQMLAMSSCGSCTPFLFGPPL